ncbi:MAG TPA: hypothetical protein VLA56_09320 [Pseudomonadales bacterium]|nr:hypothetical protein [Pseudomonadales bacterium]
MLQRTALVLTLATLLTACQGGTRMPVAAAPAAPEPTACDLLGAPTVVRYQVDVEARKQQQVQLFNGDPERALDMGCAPGAPLASVVTLRYRIVGS